MGEIEERNLAALWNTGKIVYDDETQELVFGYDLALVVGDQGDYFPTPKFEDLAEQEVHPWAQELAEIAAKHHGLPSATQGRIVLSREAMARGDRADATQKQEWRISRVDPKVYILSPGTYDIKAVGSHPSGKISLMSEEDGLKFCHAHAFDMNGPNPWIQHRMKLEYNTQLFFEPKQYAEVTVVGPF